MTVSHFSRVEWRVVEINSHSMRLIHRFGFRGSLYDDDVCSVEWHWRRSGRACHRAVRDLRRSV